MTRYVYIKCCLQVELLVGLSSVESLAPGAGTWAETLSVSHCLAFRANAGMFQVEWIQNLRRVAEFAIGTFGLASGAFHDVMSPKLRKSH